MDLRGEKAMTSLFQRVSFSIHSDIWFQISSPSNWSVSHSVHG